MLGSFLMNRVLTFRLGDIFSTPRPLNGGSPQGTLLGNFMFIVATDSLEDMPGPVTDEPEMSPPDPRIRTPNVNHREVNYDRISTPVRRSVIFQPSFGTSTPNRFDRLPDASPPSSPELEDSFTYLRSLRTPFNRLDETDSFVSLYSLSESMRREETRPPSTWTSRPPDTFKFVDDFISSVRVHTGNAQRLISERRQKITVHAFENQCFFNNVSSNATNVGMSVNAKKTQLLCISADLTSDVSAYIRTDDDTVVSSQKKLKQLGFWFGERPNANAHIEKEIPCTPLDVAPLCACRDPKG